MALPQGDLRLLETDVAKRTRTASIAVRPTWVGVLDFQTRFPNALPERLRS